MASTSWVSSYIVTEEKNRGLYLFTVDEFVKFDEKLPVHTKLFYGWKISLIHTNDYHW